MHQIDTSKFWVIGVISNPVRYKSRYELYQKFKIHMEQAGVNFMTVELQYGDRRHFEVTDACNPRHVQLRTWEEIWHKENMIDIGISRLPSDWETVAWIDCDIEFINKDWVQETVQRLQTYQIIQMFQNAIDLGPTGETLKVFDGFMWSWLTHQPMPYSKGGYPHWHSGYCWAARREAIDALGGLIDWAILGAADHHMAWALIGEVKNNTPKNVSKAYMEGLEIWQERALKHIRKDVGFLPGSIVHYHHGPKIGRQYQSRWQILLTNNFTPTLDLKRDWQNLYTFTDQGERLRNDIREYFRSRNEDLALA